MTLIIRALALTILLLPAARTITHAQLSDIPCNAGAQCFFPSPEDSLRWTALAQDFLALDSLYAETRSDSVLQSAAAAADTLLALSVNTFGACNHPATILAWKYVAETRTDAGRSQALRAFVIADSLYHDLFPCESGFSLAIRSGMGFVAWITEEYTLAESLYVTNMSIASSPAHDDSTHYAEAAYWLGMTRSYAANPAGAASALDTAYTLYRALGDSSSMSDCLYFLASARFASQDFDGSERSYLQMLRLQEALHGTIAASTVDALLELGGYYESCGRYNEATSTLADAMQRAQHPGAALQPLTLWTLHSTMARVLESAGDFAGAETAHQQSMMVSHTVPGEYRAQVLATTYNNTAIFYERRGQHAQAGRLLDEALSILDSLDTSRTLRVVRAKMLGTRGIVYRSMEQFELAERSYVEAIRLIEEEKGSDTYDLMYPLGNLALFYRDTGQPEKGYPIQMRALELHEAFWGNEHPMLGILLRNLASIELAMQLPASAITHLRRALAILDRSYDEANPDVLNCLYVYAQWLETHPDAPEAARIMSRLLRGSIERLHASFAFESEEQQLRIHDDIIMRHLSIVARWAMQQDAHPDAAAILFDGIIALKGAVLTENLRLKASMLAHTSEQSIYEELTRTREQYASLVSRSAAVEQQGLDILKHRLLRRIDSLDAALRRVNTSYARHREIETADWMDVRRVLRPGEAVVEFLDVKMAAQEDSSVYIAVVLRADNEPILVPLRTEAELLPENARQVSGISPFRVSDIASMKTLYAQAWSPIAAILSKIKTVYIVPDGILHRLPFAALLPPHAEDWRDCLDTHYHLQQLTGSKQLLLRRRQLSLDGSSANGFLLVANPQFSATQGSSPKGRGGWKQLPGTEIEMQRLRDLGDSTGIDVTVLHGDTATEQNLKSAAAQTPRVLHLATHGFFLPRQERSASKADPLIQRRGKTYLASEQHPLLRSGLILAGANAVWTGQPGPVGADDGILTALEVAHLQLNETELVVLSACETALGDIRRGEGVFGLQRAFFAAGASSLIMSLWVIPDQLTANFMQQFYRDWLAGMTKAEALRKARGRMRERFPDPRFWAPFIIIGP